ncbi:hypothetical protein ALC53_07394 [Atta colombica]|uniref:Uncharacterized protein n=1 Tax=Atta colombica TaxID=520822 RepID=A0A195BC54_9HYME|nr:hypothetical protein ALC53_07394 [Atta colombica]
MQLSVEPHHHLRDWDQAERDESFVPPLINLIQRKKISRELGTLAVPHSNIARSKDGDVGQVGRRWRRGTERASCCLTGSRESEARLYVGVTLPYAYLHRLAPSFATSPPATACLEVSSRLKDIIIRLQRERQPFSSIICSAKVNEFFGVMGWLPGLFFSFFFSREQAPRLLACNKHLFALRMARGQELWGFFFSFKQTANLRTTGKGEAVLFRQDKPVVLESS